MDNKQEAERQLQNIYRCLTGLEAIGKVIHNDGMSKNLDEYDYLCERTILGLASATEVLSNAALHNLANINDLISVNVYPRYRKSKGREAHALINGANRCFLFSMAAIWPLAVI